MPFRITAGEPMGGIGAHGTMVDKALPTWRKGKPILESVTDVNIVSIESGVQAIFLSGRYEQKY